MKNIKLNNRTTWCGFPHNLLLPRYILYGKQIYKNFIDFRSNEAGSNLVLLAFVNDPIGRYVAEGSDHIEHMYSTENTLSYLTPYYSRGGVFMNGVEFLPSRQTFV